MILSFICFVKVLIRVPPDILILWGSWFHSFVPLHFIRCCFLLLFACVLCRSFVCLVLCWWIARFSIKCRNGAPPLGDSRTMMMVMLMMWTDTNRLKLWLGFIPEYPFDQYTGFFFFYYFTYIYIYRPGFYISPYNTTWLAWRALENTH